MVDLINIIPFYSVHDLLSHSKLSTLLLMLCLEFLFTQLNPCCVWRKPIQPTHRERTQTESLTFSRSNFTWAACISRCILYVTYINNVWGRGRLGAAGPAAFFFCKWGLPSPNISANHMARILSTSYIHVHVHTRTVNVCAMLMISYVILKYAPYDWLKCNPRLQKKNGRPARSHHHNMHK